MFRVEKGRGAENYICNTVEECRKKDNRKI